MYLRSKMKYIDFRKQICFIGQNKFQEVHQCRPKIVPGIRQPHATSFLIAQCSMYYSKCFAKILILIVYKYNAVQYNSTNYNTPHQLHNTKNTTQYRNREEDYCNIVSYLPVQVSLKILGHVTHNEFHH